MYLPRTNYFSRKQKENITKFYEKKKKQSKNHYNTQCFMKGITNLETRPYDNVKDTL